MNVLFTCAGRRSYLLQYFREEMDDGDKIVGADMQLTAPALAFADVKCQVPAIYEANYIYSLLSICEEHNIDLLISLNDLELPILSENKPLFDNLGVKLLISPPAVVEIGFDKLKTIEFAKSIGVKSPKTYTSLEATEKAILNKDLSLPVVIKPRWGSASIGIYFPKTIDELKLSFELAKIQLKRSMLNVASSHDEENAILIQEMLPGIEYGVDILNHFDGQPRAVYTKEKLVMRSGETDKSVLRNNEALAEIGWKVGENLKHIGNIDCDFFVNGDDIYLLEINPRFGGGYPFTHESGGNYVRAILHWMKGKEPVYQVWEKRYDICFSKYDSIVALD